MTARRVRGDLVAQEAAKMNAVDSRTRLLRVASRLTKNQANMAEAVLTKAGMPELGWAIADWAATKRAR